MLRRETGTLGALAADGSLVPWRSSDA